MEVSKDDENTLKLNTSTVEISSKNVQKSAMKVKPVLKRSNIKVIEASKSLDNISITVQDNAEKITTIPDSDSVSATPVENLDESCMDDDWKEINLEDFTIISEATENVSDEETVGGKIDIQVKNKTKKKIIEWNGPSLLNKSCGIVEIYGSKIVDDACYSRVIIIGDSYISSLHANWPKESLFRPYFIWKKMMKFSDVGGIIKYHQFLKDCPNSLVILCFGNTDIVEFNKYKKCAQAHKKITIPTNVNNNNFCNWIKKFNYCIANTHPDTYFTFANLPKLSFDLNVDDILKAHHRKWKRCSCRPSVAYQVQFQYDATISKINSYIFNKGFSKLKNSSHFIFNGLEVLYDEAEWKLPQSSKFSLATQLYNRISSVLLPTGKFLRSQEDFLYQKDKLKTAPIYILGDNWLQCMSSVWQQNYSYLHPLFYPCKNYNFVALKEFILSAVLPDEPCLIVTSIGADYFLSYKEHECMGHTPLKYAIPNTCPTNELKEEILKGMQDISKILESRNKCKLFYMTCFPISFKGYLNMIKADHGKSYNNCINSPLMTNAECISSWESMKEKMSVIDELVVNYNIENGSHTCDIGLLLRKILGPDELLYPFFIPGKCPPQNAELKLSALMKEYLHSIEQLFEERKLTFDNSADKLKRVHRKTHSFGEYDDIVVTIKNVDSDEKNLKDNVSSSVKCHEEKMDTNKSRRENSLEMAFSDKQGKSVVDLEDIKSIAALTEFDLQVISECSESELHSGQASNFSDVSSIDTPVDHNVDRSRPEKCALSNNSDDTLNSATIIAMDAQSISSGENLPIDNTTVKDTDSISSEEGTVAKDAPIITEDMESISSEEVTDAKKTPDDMESISSEEGTVANKIACQDDMESISSAGTVVEVQEGTESISSEDNIFVTTSECLTNEIDIPVRDTDPVSSIEMNTTLTTLEQANLHITSNILNNIKAKTDESCLNINDSNMTDIREIYLQDKTKIDTYEILKNDVASKNDITECKLPAKSDEDIKNAQKSEDDLELLEEKSTGDNNSNVNLAVNKNVQSEYNARKEIHLVDVSSSTNVIKLKEKSLKKPLTKSTKQILKDIKTEQNVAKKSNIPVEIWLNEDNNDKLKPDEIKTEMSVEVIEEKSIKKIDTEFCIKTKTLPVGNNTKTSVQPKTKRMPTTALIKGKMSSVESNNIYITNKKLSKQSEMTRKPSPNKKLRKIITLNFPKERTDIKKSMKGSERVNDKNRQEDNDVSSANKKDKLTKSSQQLRSKSSKSVGDKRIETNAGKPIGVLTVKSENNPGFSNIINENSRYGKFNPKQQNNPVINMPTVTMEYTPPSNTYWSYPGQWAGTAPVVYNTWNQTAIERLYPPPAVNYSSVAPVQDANYPTGNDYHDEYKIIDDDSVNYRSPPRKKYRRDRSSIGSSDRYPDKKHDVGRYPRTRRDRKISKGSRYHRSPSPMSSLSPHRSPSPRRINSPSYSRRSSRRSIEQVALDSLREVHDKECIMYRNNPEAHPDYSKERREWFEMMTLQHGYTAESYFLQEKWKNVWKSKIEDNFNHCWEEKKNKCLSLLPASRRSRSRSRLRDRSSKRHKARKSDGKSSNLYDSDISRYSTSFHLSSAQPSFESVDALERKINEYIERSSGSQNTDMSFPQSSSITPFPSTSRRNDMYNSTKLNRELTSKIPNVLEVTSVLSEISDRFGNLGPFIRTLNDQLIRDNLMKKNLMECVMDDDSVLLLRMVCDQLSHFLGDSATSIVQKAIYLEAQEKLNNLLQSINSSKKPFNDLQLESLRNLTQGMDMMQMLKLIKQNLKLKQQSNPADKEVMDVYIALKASENKKQPLAYGVNPTFKEMMSNVVGTNRNNPPPPSLYGVLPKPRSKIDQIKYDLKCLTNVQKLDKFRNFNSLPFEEKSALLSYLDETETSNPHFAQVLRMMINDQR